MKVGALKTARRSRTGRLSTGAQILGILVLGGTAASATALLYPGRSPTADAIRPASRIEATPSTKPVARTDIRVAAAPAPESAPAAPAIRQIPLVAGVDTTPPTQPKVQLLPPSQAQPAPGQPTPSATPVASSAKAPTDCLPPGLRAMLQDVQARFGPVTLVSTTELHTDNHSAGSTRHKLHSACRAVDFKVEGDLNAVTAYLRSRPEVAGINTYKNNRVIHIDAAESRTFAQR